MRLIEKQVAALAARNVPARLVDRGGQDYVATSITDIPSPPWGSASFDIMIAVPATYDTAPLDGFYLAIPYSFESGTHPRVNGEVIQFEGRGWQLVSWHYSDGRPWRRGQDDLDSHLAHCRGFLFNRGATNAR